MNDNEPEFSDPKGQKGADREIERRNRENETSQTARSPDVKREFEEEAGQAIERSDTAVRKDKGESSAEAGGEVGGGFVATSDDRSSDYLTKGEEDEQAFAEQGQGAPATSTGRSDIEHPTAETPDAVLDEGSSAKP
jgi:hypothetical protein